MSEGELRASDAEREAVAERLRRAAGEGRLDPEELEERLGRAYAARTRRDLDALVADLPGAAAPRPAVPTAVADRDVAPLPAGRWTAAELRERAAGFLIPNLICIGIWVAGGAHGTFWPGWVLLFTTIGLVASFVRGPDAERAHGARGKGAHNHRR
jgi:Domain of unknown function (DUF1707)